MQVEGTFRGKKFGIFFFSSEYAILGSYLDNIFGGN